MREEYPQAQLLLARVLVVSEHSREAVSTLRGLALPYRRAVPALKLFGFAYYRMNRLNAAEETLEAALSAAARPDAEMHYLLGLVRLRQNDTAEAIHQAKLALAINRRYASASRLLSDAYLLQGKDALAQQALRRQLALVRRPGDAREIQQRLVMVQSMLGASKNSVATVLPQVKYIRHYRK